MANQFSSSAESDDPGRSDEATLHFEGHALTGFSVRNLYLGLWLVVVLSGLWFLELAAVAGVILASRPVRRIFVQKIGSPDGSPTVQVELVITSAGCQGRWPPRGWASSWEEVKGWSENNQWLILDLPKIGVIRVPVAVVDDDFRRILYRHGIQKAVSTVGCPRAGFPRRSGRHQRSWSELRFC